MLRDTVKRYIRDFLPDGPTAGLREARIAVLVASMNELFARIRRQLKRIPLPFWEQIRVGDC